MSAAEGDVGRRKSGFCLIRSVNCCEAVSGEWARARRVWAMWFVGAGEEVILVGYECVRYPENRALADATAPEAVEAEMGGELELRKIDVTRADKR